MAEGSTGLLKWKGVVFTADDDADTMSSSPPDQEDTEDDTASQSTLEDNSGQVSLNLRRILDMFL